MKPRATSPFRPTGAEAADAAAVANPALGGPTACTPPLDPAGPIPYGRQHVDEDDLAAVAAVLASDHLTTGPAVARFEAELAEVTGAAGAVAVSSGTAALHAAYAAAGLGRGDVLVTTPLTFASTANVAWSLGATVRFVDVDGDTGLMDPAALADVADGPDADRIRVIAPVDFAGTPADHAALGAIARDLGATLVADAAHSIGAGRGGTSVGRLADLTCLSFHPVKTITTGEGGAVLARDQPQLERLERAARFRTHGITRDAARMQAADPGGWHYEMIEFGLNYRLTDLQAALGTSQLAKLDRFIARRRAIAAAYDAALADVPGITRPVVPADAAPAWHLYVIRTADAASRRALYDALHAAGILVQVHYEAVHLHPFWREQGHEPGTFPAAEAFAASCLSLPIFPALTDAMLDRCIDAVRTCAMRLFA